MVRSPYSYFNSATFLLPVTLVYSDSTHAGVKRQGVIGLHDLQGVVVLLRRYAGWYTVARSVDGLLNTLCRRACLRIASGVQVV
jgi:hypothetical protein